MKKILSKRKPRYLIAYLCWNCNFISYLDDLEKSKCSDCGNDKNLLIISKEKYGQSAINKSMKTITEKIIKLLDSDIKSGDYDSSLLKNNLLEKRGKAQKLKKVLDKKKVSKKERDKYIISLNKNF
jgi:hypothetical protein